MDSSHTAPPPAGSHPLGSSLRRSSSDRLLLGLCGGVARALDVSPVAVRIGTLLLGIALLPATVLAYLVTAVILPADDDTVIVGRGERRSRDVTTALLLTFVGAPLVIGAGAAWGLTSGPLVWPLLLLGAGAALGVAFYRPRADAATQAAQGHRPFAQPVAPPITQSPAPQDAPPPQADQAVDDTAVTAIHDDTAVTAIQDAAPEPAGPEMAASEPTAAATSEYAPPTFVKGPVPPPPSDPTDESSTTEEPPPARRGLVMPVIAAMALIPAVFAVLYAVDAIDGGWSTWAVMLAILALTAAGGAVLIALLRPSYLGAALLVILAALLGTGSIALSQVGPLLDDGVGERTYRPQSPSEIQPVYRLGLGELDLDLRDLELRRGSRTPIRAQLGFGQVRVAVPRGVRVVAAPGSSLTAVTISARRNGASEATSASAPTLVLDVAMRGGDVQLVSGGSPNMDNLEIVAEQSTGFWDPNGDADRFDGLQDFPPLPSSPPSVPSNP